jgi:hypothetical protein
MSTTPSLGGVELICPVEGEFPDPLYADTYEHIAVRAAGLGATIIRDPDGFPALHKQHLLNNPNAFTVTGSAPVIHDATTELFAHAEELGIAYPARHAYAAATSETLNLPFMLSASGVHGGMGKYLIENEAQLKVVHKAVKDHSQWRIAELLTTQEWIETPSTRFTSYRVITSPVSVLAAGLLYSNPTSGKNQPVFHELSRQPITEKSNMWGKSIMNAFEDPRSPYFLNARDVRSNIELGGGCIPLMGENQRKLTPVEEGLLEAHGIDPAHSALPEHVSRPALVVAGKVGRVAGLAIGSDFLQDAKSLGVSKFLEANTGPGTATWNECWNGGANGVPDEVAIRQMLDRALDSIVAVM